MSAMITVSEAAAKHIERSLLSRGKGLGIRLGVKTTGCSGMAYVLEYVDEPQAHDEEVKVNDVSIFVDPKSMVYLKGTSLDFVKEGLNEGFVFNNPNSAGECGCGESFHV